MSGYSPDRLVFVVLCTVTALSALVSGSIYPFSSLFFSLSVLICLIISLTGKPGPAIAALWPGWAWLSVLYLSSAWTVSLNATISQAFFFTAFVIFSCVAAYSSGGDRSERFLMVVVGVSTVISLYGIYQYAAGFGHTEDYLRAYGAYELGLSEKRISKALGAIGYRRAFSTLLSPNVLACYLAAAFPAGMHLVYRARGAGSRAAYIAMLAVILCTIMLTKSVGGFISLVVGAVVFALAVSASGGRDHLRKASALILAAVLIAAAAGYFVVAKRTGGFLGVGHSFQERLNYYGGALDAFADAPMAGNGAGSFFLTYYSRVKPGAGETRFAHNLALQTLSETGILGLAAMVLLWGVFFVRCTRGVRQRPGEAPYPAMVAGGSAILAHNMLDFTFYVHETALLFWLYFGMAAAPSFSTYEAGAGRSRNLIKIVAVVLVIAFSLFYLRAVMAAKSQNGAVAVLREHGMASALAARSGPPPEEALSLAEKAVSLKPYDDYYRDFLANLYEGAAYGKGREFAARAEQQYRKAAALSRLYPYHQRDLGILYVKLGRPGDAKECFEKAVSLYPADEDLAKLLSNTEK